MIPIDIAPNRNTVDIAQEELPHIVVGACMEVHKHLGHGLGAGAYRDCLAHELRLREIVFERDAPFRFDFKGARIEAGEKLDFVVEGAILVKVEACSELLPEHKAQLNSLLRLSGYECGFLVNFGAEKLRDGIKRLIVSESEPPVHYR